MSSALSVQATESGIVSSVSADALVWIESPQDGQRLSSPVTLSFGSSGVEISPAGIERNNSGHHHLLINLQTLPAMDMPLPANAQVMHFGKGQTQATIELEPGVHSLQLLLGNHLHVPHARPVMSDKITITVE
jgi:hypothetical protein